MRTSTGTGPTPRMVEYEDGGENPSLYIFQEARHRKVLAEKKTKATDSETLLRKLTKRKGGRKANEGSGINIKTWGDLKKEPRMPYKLWGLYQEEK